MTRNDSLERRLAAFYSSEPSLRAPDRVLLGALATIDATPQRRGLNALRRYFEMPSYLKLAAAAVIVVAAGGLALWQLAPPGPGGVASPTPSPTPTAAPNPTAAPTPTALPTAPPLTGSHVSELYGMTIAIPAGWTARAGTDPWDLHALPGFGSELSTADLIQSQVDPDLLFISVSSHILDRGETGAEWADDLSAAPDPGPCPTFDTVVVAGLDGRIYECNEPLRALFWDADIGYYVSIYRSDDVPWYADVYDRAWFEELLATVELNAGDPDGGTPTLMP